MSKKNTMNTYEQFLIIILRVVGSVSLLALIFVFVPYSWMNTIHFQLGMGELPSNPIVGYLARSTSAFYALLGALLIVTSFNIQKHIEILKFLGIAISLMGLLLFWIDWYEGMPLFWKVWEGPFVFFLGIVLFFLSRSVCKTDK